MFQKLCYNAQMKFKTNKKNLIIFSLFAIFMSMSLASCRHSSSYVRNAKKSKEDIYQEYIAAFEEIYESMKENYYQDISIQKLVNLALWQLQVATEEPSIYQQYQLTSKSKG